MTKLEALLRRVLLMREIDPGSKALVFSQFPDALVLASKALDVMKVGGTGSMQHNVGFTWYMKGAWALQKCWLWHKHQGCCLEVQTLSMAGVILCMGLSTL